MTHRRHYENYRAAKLSGIAEGSNFKTHDGQDPMTLMDAEKREHEAKLRKMEADMEAVFAQKVGLVIFLAYPRFRPLAVIARLLLLPKPLLPESVFPTCIFRYWGGTSIIPLKISIDAECWMCVDGF